MKINEILITDNQRNADMSPVEKMCDLHCTQNQSILFTFHFYLYFKHLYVFHI